MSFEPLRWWRSTRTFCEYPVEWRLRVPGADLDLTLKASFDDQEFITFVSPPAFWAGRCDINGTLRGAKTQGLGHLERVGFEADRSLDGFFSAVGREVRASIVHALPLEPTIEQARDLVASRERAHYLDGLDLHQLARALIKPIREITDRGGKSWRSYAALACCDVVKGDSRLFVQWLALPELLHVGSLIVDDVQDRSTVRRGGPTCHMTYGEPLAINAGTAAYFIAQRLLVLATGAISPERKLRFYDLYFEALRAGHAGQALDLDGPSHLVPEAVESGDSSLLERRVLATYQLKTAAPVSALARMGAVAGGGSDAQVDALGHFFDAVGLAFQITDDVLNVRGFKHELKLRGEDLTNGTITLPFARALSRLPVEDRRWLWRTLQSKPSDPAVIASMVEKLVASGALNACVEQAHQMIESAWRVAEPLLEESFAKVMLRAFTWYSLERE
jgi:geranylgeranyl pyrophosphate synthase